MTAVPPGRGGAAHQLSLVGGRISVMSPCPSPATVRNSANGARLRTFVCGIYAARAQDAGARRGLAPGVSSARDSRPGRISRFLAALAGGQDLAAAVMAVPCLPAGKRVPAIR